MPQTEAKESSSPRRPLPITTSRKTRVFVACSLNAGHVLQVWRDAKPRDSMFRGCIPRDGPPAHGLNCS